MYMFLKKMNECYDDKNFFYIVDTMIGRKRNVVLPKYDDSATLASMLNSFFIDKINTIMAEFSLLESNLPLLVSVIHWTNVLQLRRTDISLRGID